MSSHAHTRVLSCERTAVCNCFTHTLDRHALTNASLGRTTHNRYKVLAYTVDQSAPGWSARFASNEVTGLQVRVARCIEDIGPLHSVIVVDMSPSLVGIFPVIQSYLSAMVGAMTSSSSFTLITVDSIVSNPNVRFFNVSGPSAASSTQDAIAALTHTNMFRTSLGRALCVDHLSHDRPSHERLSHERISHDHVSHKKCGMGVDWFWCCDLPSESCTRPTLWSVDCATSHFTFHTCSPTDGMRLPLSPG
jgi:hypothetical protein